MKNITAYIGNLHHDLSALRRKPKQWLATGLDPQVANDVDGLIFGHMQDDDEHDVVCVNRVVLGTPVRLDVHSGRHTGVHEKGPKAGKVKHVGPNPTTLTDLVAWDLLADLLAANPRKAAEIRAAVGSRVNQ